MLYLLDANTLISAHNTWYALKRVPEFWLWILHQGNEGRVKIPSEIYAEIEAGSDDLADWMKEGDNRRALMLAEVSDISKVRAVLSCYGNPLSEADLIKIGQDPFLIAAALGYDDRFVVTAEVSSPGKLGANRKVPNVCDDCNVIWKSPITFINELNFTTDWKP